MRRPVPVAPLLLETEDERRLFRQGETNSQAKKALRTRSLLQKAPDDEESNLIHSMWTKEMSYLSMASLFAVKLNTDNAQTPNPPTSDPPTRYS